MIPVKVDFCYDYKGNMVPLCYRKKHKTKAIDQVMDVRPKMIGDSHVGTAFSVWVSSKEKQLIYTTRGWFLEK